MLLDKMIRDLEDITKQKKDLNDGLNTALQCEDIIKARLFYSLIDTIENEESKLLSEVNNKSSLN